MRKLSALILFVSIGSIAHAQAEQTKAFDCVDTKTFEVNSQCMADRIGDNVEFRDMQLKIVNNATNNDKNVMATMKFYPKDMLIEVVAHRDAISDASLSAANRN